MPPAQDPNSFDLVCLSHLRWDFVYQRPQHLLSRCAKERRVFFVEEAMFDASTPYLDMTSRPEGVQVVVPHLSVDDRPQAGWEVTQQTLLPRWDAVQREMLSRFLQEQQVNRFVLWFYAPMATEITRALTPLATVYDCMDELSAFSGAPPVLREREDELFRRADLVFTGGQSLYEAKKSRHPHVFAFPSSVDVPHFAQARALAEEPADQADIPRPRLGFFGVIDERMDLDLLAGVADLRPDWHLIMIGPVVKIDPAALPQRANIHYLGGKKYDELPQYLAGWDLAMMPFARNESTRFISPTKTPEYLAAGRPVVSTSIRDVVRPYGEQGLVRIADTPVEFVAAAEAALQEDAQARRQKADAFLAQMSWDKTWARMAGLIEEAVQSRAAVPSAEAARAS